MTDVESERFAWLIAVLEDLLEAAEEVVDDFRCHDPTIEEVSVDIEADLLTRLELASARARARLALADRAP